MSNCNNIGIYNFDCVIQKQGYTVDMTFTTGESEEVEPLDLRVYDQIKLAIKSGVNEIVTTLTLEDGLSVIGEDFNILEVFFSQDLTEVLKTRIYNYDILFINDAVNQYFLKGEIKVTNTITR
jgi:hypothetical protein